MTARRGGGSIVLLSGGMDSATTLYWSKRRDPVVHALTLGYGQRHAREIESARRLAKLAGAASHSVVDLPLGPLLRSALTDRTARLRSSGVSRGIPASYVPARNTIFLAIALGAAESRGADRIVLGINAVDYSGYPDCRPEYLRAFQRLARLGTRVGVQGGKVPKIVAPLLKASKADIVRLGERLGVPWGETWSCYRGGRRPCGRCDSCRLRAKGFEEAGVLDPLVARSRSATRRSA